MVPFTTPPSLRSWEHGHAQSLRLAACGPAPLEHGISQEIAANAAADDEKHLGNRLQEIFTPLSFEIGFADDRNEGGTNNKGSSSSFKVGL